MELGPAPLPNPPPSFAVKGLLALRAKLKALLDASAPVELVLFDRMTGFASTMTVGIVAKLGIPDVLDRRGPLHAEEIAKEVGCDPDATFRVMRALSLTGLFKRDASGRFDLNRISSALRSGQPSRTREFAIYLASASNVRAWIELEHTLRTGKNAFEHVHGKSVWDWFEEHADEREMFAQAMMGMTTAEAPLIATLYPFSEVRTVCDVGGGRGTLLSEILIRHAHLKGILCDAKGVLESGKSLLAGRGVLGRVTLVPGSFFDEVPRGADAYVLKNILHDWDDARSVKILKVVRAAMDPGAKLVVCEAIVERDTDEAMAALADLQMMMVCCEGRERGKADFARLFAEGGFDSGRVFEGPMGSVLEAIAR